MARWIGLPMVLSAMLPFADSRPAPRSDSLPDISFNDNLSSAGRLVRGTLTLELDIVSANWRPTDPKGDPIEVLAFAEAGKAPLNPGPMIRVPLGTALRVTVTNRSGIAVAVRGLTSRKKETPDSLLLAPGASGEARFTADAEGTFYYWAGAPGRRLTGPAAARRIHQDSQLNGAFIVDPPGGARPSNERIFVIGLWNLGRDSATVLDRRYELYTVNGRPWPGTERLTYTMGDSVHWRVINASADVHPLHLHGFYFRVDARGDVTRDTLYWPSERRMAVTERLPPGTTMRMAWSPDRPGGWVFHCHLTFHISPNPLLGSQRLPPEQRAREIAFGHSHVDPQHHVEQGMGGLMMGIYVRPSPGWKPSTEARRTIRLFVMTDSTATDTVRRFGYLADEGGGEPVPRSIRAPGSTLVLHRGEPTTIWVINRAGEPTAIHWHGMELESPFDGVVGVGGYTGSPTPTIMPGDSFEVRMTPPRAGSFMYHTHVSDIRQLSA